MSPESSMNDYMIRFDKRARKSPRDDRDQSFEHSWDMNSDLADSSIGYSPHTGSAMERLKKFK